VFLVRGDVGPMDRPKIAVVREETIFRLAAEEQTGK